MATVNVILEDRGCIYKIDHNSTITYPRLLKIVSFQSLDIALFPMVSNANYIISIFMNFHAKMKNGRKIFKKSINELISGPSCRCDTLLLS